MEQTAQINHDDCLWECHDPPGYIHPSQMDIYLPDFTKEHLKAAEWNFEHSDLSVPNTFPGTFPANGMFYGYNKRLLVNLMCRRESRHVKEYEPVSLIFLVCVTSPYSYLSKTAMNALSGNDIDENMSQMRVQIHSDRINECYLASPDKNFVNINVVGMDFITNNKLSIVMNHRKNQFQLIQVPE